MGTFSPFFCGQEHTPTQGSQGRTRCLGPPLAGALWVRVQLNPRSIQLPREQPKSCGRKQNGDAEDLPTGWEQSRAIGTAQTMSPPKMTQCCFVHSLALVIGLSTELLVTPFPCCFK